MISITKSELAEQINEKYLDVKIAKIGRDVGNKISEISQFRDILKDYFSLVMNLACVPILEDMIDRISRRYPYISFLEEFMELTKWEDNNNEFKGFQGFIFITPLKEKIKIVKENDLYAFCVEAKRIAKYLNTQVIHRFKIMKIEDLDYIPRERKTKDLPRSTDKIFVDFESGQLIFNGKPFYKLNKNKFPFMTLEKGLKTKKKELSINDMPCNIEELNDYMNNFNKYLKKKLKESKASKEIYDRAFLSKPSAIIVISDILEGI